MSEIFSFDGQILYVVVESDPSCIVIRHEPDEANSHCEDRQDAPADEGKPEVEQVELVAAHHMPAGTQGVSYRHLRMFVQDVWNHGIGKGKDDAWDNEEEKPDRDDYGIEDHAAEFMPIVGEPVMENV